MTEVAPDISIIIVNWNTRELLAKCLESLVTSSNLQFLAQVNLPEAAQANEITGEVWVVDNGSSDGSMEMLHAQFSWVRSLQNRENVGFARANNQAFQESLGHYVLLLNPDTVVSANALEWMVRFMNNCPWVGAVGPRLLSPDGKLQISCHPAPTLPGEMWQLFHLDALWPFGVYRMTEWDLGVSRKVEVLQGACLLLRREALEAQILFDEDYFMYSEEVDLCHRLSQAGWSLCWTPQAKVVHYGGQSTQQAAAEMFLHLYRSKLLYFRKHHGRLAALGYKLILAAAAVTRVSLSPLAWLLHRRQRNLILASRYLYLLRMLPQL